jgi:outer membrane immunogenic protein
MKRFGIAMLLALLSIGAQAADFPTKTTPLRTAPVPAVSMFGPWGGFYTGVKVGYGYDVSGINLTDPGVGTAVGGAPHGFTGGLQAGYDWHAGSLVVGLVTDINAADFSTSGTAINAAWSSRTNWWGTTDARLGLTGLGNHVLLYGLGGLAYGGRTSNVSGGGISNSGFGWNAGGGIETRITPNMSIFAQAKYIDIGSIQPVPGANQDFHFGVFETGVNLSW